MNNTRPSVIAVITGGAVLLIATFLDWWAIGGGGFSFSQSLWDFGLQGLFMFVIAAVIIAIPALTTFAPQVKLPEQVLSFTRTQLTAALGFTAFLLSFSVLFRSESAKIGTILGLLGSIAVLVGSWMELQAEGAAATGDAPRPI